jgi:hypothetical protein
MDVPIFGGESGHGQDGQEHYQGQQGGQILLSFHLSFLLYWISHSLVNHLMTNFWDFSEKTARHESVIKIS